MANKYFAKQVFGRWNGEDYLYVNQDVYLAFEIKPDFESLEAENARLVKQLFQETSRADKRTQEVVNLTAALAQANARLEVMRDAGEKLHHVLLYRDEHDILPLGEFSKEEHEAIDAWQALSAQPMGSEG